MNRLFTLFLFSATFGHAQTTINYYPIPDKNAFRTRALDLENGEFALLFDSYCYTPGAIVIDGCPRGYYLYRLDAAQDTIWTRHLKLGYPDLASIYWDQTAGTTKVFGGLSPVSGECNEEFIFSTSYSGFSWPTVHNLSASGAFLDSAKFTADNCFLEYRLARKLPGNRTLLGLQYFERSSQGPVTYAEARYYLLDDQDEIDQEFSYPGKYYFGTKWTEADSTNTLFIHFNLDNDQYELVKIDEQGNEIWTKAFEGSPVGPGYVYVKDIQILKNGDIAVQGTYIDNQLEKNILNRYDPDANLLWSKEFDNAVSYSALGELENGQLLYGESVLNGTSRDILLRVLGPNGDSVNGKWYPLSPGTDRVWSITGKTDGFYFAGEAFDGLDSIYGPARAFFAFDKIETTAVEEDYQLNRYGIFPNPATTFVQIRNFSTIPIENIYLFDAAGKKIRTFYDRFEDIDIADLAPGFYMLQVCDTAKNIFTQKLLKL
ncbi:MAG: hypothetical protein EPGJADBJ_03879 [Saprospiraceae bacterium]|nr:hypothetical protein [Saprospiraceae bacterium]